MKITLFTSNQPRHLALIRRLAGVADEVFVVQECTTIFPGQVEDFYRRSEVMQAYFSQVIAAETEVFGCVGFVPTNVRQMVLRMGDLSRLPLEALQAALCADLFIVFGASYIRGPLIDALLAREAVNIHMGTSPYYRGSSCNFWASYDGRPDYVGATIHLLSKGLDSGEMLFHAFPYEAADDPFVHGMRAVLSAHKGLCRHIADGTLLKMPRVPQDRSRELRYTRNADFNDEVAADYLAHLPSTDKVRHALVTRDSSIFLNPFYG